MMHIIQQMPAFSTFTVPMQAAVLTRPLSYECLLNAFTDRVSHLAQVNTIAMSLPLLLLPLLLVLLLLLLVVVVSSLLPPLLLLESAL
jgi:hypothetical protein